jgi:DNA (cytosine-5)-methyltransferase 1
MTEMTAIELFAGAGGLGLGVSGAGFKPLLVAEWDHWSCSNIRLNRGSGGPLKSWPEPHEGDVRTLDYRGLEGKVTLVSGGPPCQPFSLGGKHKGSSDTRDMWPEAVRAVRETRPKAFIFENVKGLKRQSFASYLSYIELQLRYPSVQQRSGEEWRSHLARLQQHETGRPRDTEEYRVVFDILNAADFGVPQRRERVVFVGLRSDLEISWSIPKRTHSFEALLWAQTRTQDYWEHHKVRRADRNIDARNIAAAARLSEKPRERRWMTTRDAISDLPDPEAPTSRKIANHRFQPGAKSYPGHTGSPLDEPAKTLKAGVHGVPGGENMLVKPDGAVRYFTVRESARLQTFPDKYVFQGSWSESMRQLGNAVPVSLANAIARSVRNKLNSKSQKAPEPYGF